MKLICFPYAGASCTIYNRWQSLGSPELVVRPIELAGKGHRIEERLYEGFRQLIDDMMVQVSKEIITGPYCFFGHSLGAKIAFELSRRLEAEGGCMPQHIFVSGRRAPFTGKNLNKYAGLTDEEFVHEVNELGGSSPELFQSKELMDFFLPILRSDFILSEFEEKVNDYRPLKTNITALFGREEGLTPVQINGWKDFTTGSYVVHYFPGGHFFINDYGKEVIDLIKLEVKRVGGFASKAK